MTQILSLLLSLALSFFPVDPGPAPVVPLRAESPPPPPPVLPPDAPKPPKRKPVMRPEEVTWSYLKSRHR